MTLGTRNKLIMSFFIMTILFTIIIATLISVSLFTGNTVIPQNVSRPSNFLGDTFLTGYNFMAALFSAIICLVYTAVTTCIIYINFEKTQSSEIIYFAMFLLGCMLEGIRIALLAYNIWATVSSIYIFMGRILFFGRMLSALSLIFLVLLSIKQDAHQDAGRNSLIIAAAAGVFAWLVPIDTITVASNCSVRFGNEKIFIVITCICFIICFFSMRAQSKTLDNKEYKTASNGYLSLVFGYLLLTQTDSILALALGIILLFSGTFLFLKNLHRYYKWM